MNDQYTDQYFEDAYQLIKTEPSRLNAAEGYFSLHLGDRMRKTHITDREKSFAVGRIQMFIDGTPKLRKKSMISLLKNMKKPIEEVKTVELFIAGGVIEFLLREKQSIGQILP